MNKVLYMVAFVKEEIKSSIGLSRTSTATSFNPQANTQHDSNHCSIPKTILQRSFLSQPPPPPPHKNNKVGPQELCMELLYTCDDDSVPVNV